MVQSVHDPLLVAGHLEIDVELDVRPGVLREVGQPLFQRQRLGRGRGAEVVREHEPSAAVFALWQHVELDHVHTGRESRVEALECVARGDQVRALVPDPLQRSHVWHRGHQYVGRFPSPCPRRRIGAPQRGQGRPARP